MARKDKSYYKDVQMVDKNVNKYCKEIQKMLLNYEYKIEAKDYTKKIINDKGKIRELNKLPYYPHRIIQWAIMLQIQEIFHKQFTNFTCASLPRRGIHKALDLLKNYLKDEENTKYCLKLDIYHFYPSINQKILKEMLRRKFKDPELLWLLDLIIDSHNEGLPIGSYLSQYLANFYLSYFDHWLKEEKNIKYVIRYMDDIVILDKNKKTLHKLKQEIEKYLINKLNLKIKDNWQVFPVESRGIDFVGYKTFHNYSLLRKNTKQRFIKAITEIHNHLEHHTTLTSHQTCIVHSYNGWLKWCNSYKLKKKYITKQIELLAFAHSSFFKWRKTILGDKY